MSVKLFGGKEGGISNSEINSNYGDGKGPGAYHLAKSNSKLYEPQRENNFEFVVDISSIDFPTTTGTQTVSDAQELIRLSVSKTFVPSFSQQPIEVQKGNNKVKYAGVPSFQSGTLEINDYIGNDAFLALQAWQYQSYNPHTEKVGLAQDYKKECTLLAYSPDGQITKKWFMHGCWISNLTCGDFNNEGSGKKTISVEIQYDHAELSESL